MPLDPATIRATAQRVVDAQDLLTEQEIIDMHDALTPPTKLDRADDMVGAWRTHAFAFARAAYAKGLAAQSHATALADAEREAARKAWDAAREYWWEHGFNGRGGVDIARNTYLAREYPEAREVVKCALCRQPGADLSTGTHATRDECIEALGKAFATTEGAR